MDTLWRYIYEFPRVGRSRCQTKATRRVIWTGPDFGSALAIRFIATRNTTWRKLRNFRSLRKEQPLSNFRYNRRATNMVCRGEAPITNHLYGLTAAPLAPQRVVGYRPTYRFLPAGYPGKCHLAVVLYQKAISRPVAPTRWGTGFRMRVITQPRFRYATGSRRSVEQGRRVQRVSRPDRSRHYVWYRAGRKRRPTGRFFSLAAPSGASDFRAAW